METLDFIWKYDCLEKRFHFLIFPAARYGMQLRWMICKQKVFWFVCFCFYSFSKTFFHDQLACALCPFLLHASFFSTGCSLVPIPREFDPFPWTMRWKAWAEFDETWVYDIMELHISPGTHIFRLFLKQDRNKCISCLSQYYYVICNQTNPKWWAIPVGENSNWDHIYWQKYTEIKEGLEWLDWGRHVLIPLLGLWPKLSALRLE